MKRSTNAYPLLSYRWIFPSLLFIAIAASFSSCKKTAHTEEEHAGMERGGQSMANANPLHMYSGLPNMTMMQLHQARTASARYAQPVHAEKDGYTDINVIAPFMGYHYMKPAILDGNFDPSQPEILVYNKGANGQFYLVAVEYAVPLNLPRPEGFHGSADVWSGNTDFQLWLLHAWVWQHNPAGVFNPTNATVHVH